MRNGEWGVVNGEMGNVEMVNGEMVNIEYRILNVE